ncbi:MAG: glycosyltransferase family 39 protein [Anaerolineae bacterium]|jgi:hypothetical protein
MSESTSPLTPARSRWVAVGLLLVLFAQLATSSAIKSPVFDEPLHMARAYYVTATGDWDMQGGHVSLLYRLLGAMLWAMPGRPTARELASSNDRVELAREIFRSLDRPWDAVIFPLRFVVMALTLLLGVILYRWAGERHGVPGSLLALLVYTFSPNVLAHGRLVTTDLVLTCFVFLAVYAFERLLLYPTAGRCALAGLSLGLALGSKVSALLLLPVFVLLVIIRSAGVGSKPGRRSGAASPWLLRFLSGVTWLVLTGVIATMVVWLLYGLEIGPWAEGWPVLPLPSYTRAVLRVREHGGARGHPAFLMGERSGDGWRAYFPIALAIKTPLPTLIAALAGMAWLCLRKRWWAWLTAFFPIVIFLFAAIAASLNIGYRHILPVVPFFILLLSSLAELPWQSLYVAVPGVAMALWLVVGTLGIYPDYLAYFNALAGGPGGGHRYLTDSNLDWGQDLKRLGNYLEERDIEQVHLSYFGNVDPAAYGIQYEPLPSHFSIGEVEDFTPFSPEPGIYAISITNLSGQFLAENPSVLDWFNHQAPIASIGHSINVYRVEQDSPPPTWVGICQAPGAPLDNATVARQAGREDLRFIAFDCRGSWVFANEGDPTWFIVPATDGTEEVAPPAGSWRTTYEQENYDGKRLFTVYRWYGNGDLEAHLDALQRTASLPARVGDTLTLLGYDTDTSAADASQQGIRLRTYWRVAAQPSQPLSLMAHLVDSGGQPVAIGDALGVPVEGWAPGDIIVQGHQLALGSETTLENGQLQVGAYWWPGLERLPAFDKTGDRLADDVISLGEIDVGIAQ